MPKKTSSRTSGPKIKKPYKRKAAHRIPLLPILLGIALIIFVLAFRQKFSDVKGIADQACKVGVNSFIVEKSCEGGYRYARVTCYDGITRYTGGEMSCKTEAAWKQYAQTMCAGTSSCAIKATPTPTTTYRMSPTPTPQGYRRPQVEAVCTDTSDVKLSLRVWKITNSNANNVSLEYTVNNSSKLRATVNAKSQLLIQTAKEKSRTDVLRVYESGKLIDADSSTNRACKFPTPVLTKYPTSTPNYMSPTPTPHF